MRLFETKQCCLFEPELRLGPVKSIVRRIGENAAHIVVSGTMVITWLRGLVKPK